MHHDGQTYTDLPPHRTPSPIPPSPPNDHSLRYYPKYSNATNPEYSPHNHYKHCLKESPSYHQIDLNAPDDTPLHYPLHPLPVPSTQSLDQKYLKPYPLTLNYHFLYLNPTIILYHSAHLL